MKMAETAGNADLRSAQRAEGPRATCRCSPWASEIRERPLRPVAPRANHPAAERPAVRCAVAPRVPTRGRRSRPAAPSGRLADPPDGIFTATGPRRSRCSRHFLHRLPGLLLLAGLATSGCLRPGFDRNAMLGAVADTAILPAHRQLVEEAEQLDAAARQFASAPTLEGLESLRAAWLSVSLAWKGVEVYELPGTFLFHNAIEKRPARAAFIEETSSRRRIRLPWRRSTRPSSSRWAPPRRDSPPSST